MWMRPRPPSLARTRNLVPALGGSTHIVFLGAAREQRRSGHSNAIDMHSFHFFLHPIDVDTKSTGEQLIWVLS